MTPWIAIYVLGALAAIYAAADEASYRRRARRRREEQARRWAERGYPDATERIWK